MRRERLKKANNAYFVPKRGIQRAASDTLALPGLCGSKKYAALNVAGLSPPALI